MRADQTDGRAKAKGKAPWWLLSRFITWFSLATLLAALILMLILLVG